MNTHLRQKFASSETASEFGWTVLRLTVAVLIAAHGWVRLIDGGVVPFGESWLEMLQPDAK